MRLQDLCRLRLIVLLSAFSAYCVQTLWMGVGNAQPKESGCFPRCRSGYLCHQGACVSACNPPCPSSDVCGLDGQCFRPVTGVAVPAYPHESTPESAKEGTVQGVLLRINALSPLQFGVDPTVEFGSQVSAWLRVRLLNAGLASYFILADPEDDEEFIFGLGSGAGFRIYRGPGMQGAFGGAAVEHVYTQVDDREEDLAEYRAHHIVPQGEFGYRWAWAGFMLDLGVVMGVAFPVAFSAEPSTEGGCVYEDSCTDSTDASFYGTLILGFGVQL